MSKETIAAFDRALEAETALLRAEFFEKVVVFSEVEVVKNCAVAGRSDAELSRWQRERVIFSILHEGREHYPAFQFGADGKPLAIIYELLEIFARYPARSGWDNALWFAAENDWLDGDAPIDLLISEPALVKDAAEQAVLPHTE